MLVTENLNNWHGLDFQICFIKYGMIDSLFWDKIDYALWMQIESELLIWQYIGYFMLRK